MAESKDKAIAYPIFKGLQKPLEFMGLQGRYIVWAAIAAGCALVGFIIAFLISGFFMGLMVMLVSLGVGAVYIMVKQRRGLHTKKIDKGIFVYSHLKNL